MVSMRDTHWATQTSKWVGRCFTCFQ